MTKARAPMVSFVFGAELDAPSKATIKSFSKAANFAASAIGPGARLPSHYWNSAAANALQAVRQAFDRPLGDIMIDAWMHYEPFLKYCDGARYPPNVISQEDLLQHTVEVHCEPVVDVLLHEQKILELKFDVAVEVHVTDGTLTIQNGRFKSIRLGTCTATGSIALKEKTIIKKESEKLVLSSEISFGDGVPINGHSDETHVSALPR